MIWDRRKARIEASQRNDDEVCFRLFLFLCFIYQMLFVQIGASVSLAYMYDGRFYFIESVVNDNESALLLHGRRRRRSRNVSFLCSFFVLLSSLEIDC